MLLRHRLTDIYELRTHLLQDYFRMGMGCLYPDGEWKTKLIEYINSNKLQKEAWFAETWKKIQKKGIENYDIEDMDASIIIALNRRSTHRKAPKSPFIVICDAEYILMNLKDDRNNDFGHPSFNEPLGEQLGWAYCTLTNMDRLLEVINETDWGGNKAKSNQIAFDENTKKMLVEKYRKLIREQRDGLESDFREAIAEDAMIMYEIKTLTKSKGLYRDWQRLYLQKYAIADDNLEYKFLKAAAEADIKYAYEYLANIYFDMDGKNGKKGLETNYQRAAKFYRKYIALDNAPNKSVYKLNLASIYINELDKNHTKEEGKTLLDSVRQQETEEVIEYTTEKGYTFYTFEYYLKQRE